MYFILGTHKNINHKKTCIYVFMFMSNLNFGIVPITMSKVQELT